MPKKGSITITGLEGSPTLAKLTALGVVAGAGDVSALKHLLKISDVNEKGENGLTPLHVAAFRGHADCVQVLLAAEGIEIETRHPDGSTPLHATAAM